MMNSDYFDLEFQPKREFWLAMSQSELCPDCGHKATRPVRVWELLDGPVECSCSSCDRIWDVAIPQGAGIARQKILDLLQAEKRFYELREELMFTINRLHGRRG